MPKAVRDLLREVASGYDVSLSEKQVGQFLCYLKLIQRWQKGAVRLVGSDEPPELVGVHVADAFCMYRCVSEWRGKRLIDIGSGAGFPGVCLKIVEAGLGVTLVEASAKKASFLAKVRAELGFENVDIVRGRAEKLGRETESREQFDVATMRAVASLPRALEIGLPFVRVGGYLVVARGKSSRGDVETTERIGGRMGGGQVVVYSGSVGEVRVRGSILVLTKVSRTAGCYPRERAR